MQRRTFLQAGLAVAGSFALGADFWKRAYAAPAVIGPGPYGGLQAADANGLLLPPGFRSRVLATAYQPVTRADGSQTAFLWHRASDGGGVIPQPDGGWIYVNNSEIPIVADECADDPASPFCGEQGGCSAIRFDAEGRVIDAYPILQGTNNNCAGGVTPWGTWLSCEENFLGFVYECDPTGLNPALRLPALGQFAHEAAAVDPIGKAIYLTEDTADGAFYRFRPLRWPDQGRPDLSVGVLEVAVVGDNPPTRLPYAETLGGAAPVETGPGLVRWEPVPNPLGLPLECRYQVPTAAVFLGGEGCWYDDGQVFFTCKGSNRVWAYHTQTSQLEIVYDAAALGPDAPLTGVDNLTVHPHSHDLFVAEDGGNMEIVLITDDTREVAPFLRYPVPHSELCGVAFDPTGSRLYFASQAKRHRVDEVSGRTIVGEIFEVSGPFRGAAAGGGGGGSTPGPGISGGGAVTALGLGALAAAALARVLESDRPGD
ncbi:MAG TPA: alkaline phosphatase PhoX [Nevskiaceae bacterium]|nr:alkaline phosphatase PhoX [Nevskiaceae bacterium]